MRFKIILTLLLSLLPVLSSEAQVVNSGDPDKISGTVRDARSRESIAGVILQLRNAESKLIAYCISDGDGHFELQVNPDAAELKAALMGYKTAFIKAPFSQSMTILLEESKEQIKASVVKASTVEEKGDTIVHTAAAYRSREDTRLQDILMKIPGLSLTDNGLVKYNDKPINRLYIDGRDVLENNYEIAVKSLRSEDIKTVSIYRNHQPIKALRDLVESESAALNIELKEEARGRWAYSVGITAGAEQEEPSGFVGNDYANAIKTSDRNAFFNLVSANNMGELSGSTESNISVEEEQHNRRRIDDYVSSTDYRAPVESRYSLFNKSARLQSLNNFVVGEESNINTVVKYGYDNLSSSRTSILRYIGEDDDMVFNDLSESVSEEHSASASVTYIKNSSKLYIRNMLYADFLKKSSSLFIDARSEDSQVSQQLGISNLNVNNTLSLTFRSGNDRAYSLYWYSQESLHDSRLAVAPQDVSQAIDNDVVYGLLYLRGISGMWKKWKMSLMPRVEYMLKNLRVDEYDFSSISAKPGADMSVIRENRNVKLSADASLRYMYFSSSSESVKDASLLYYLVRLSAERRWARLRLSGTLSAGSNTNNEDSVYDGYVWRDYRNVWTGLRSFISMPYQSASMSIRYEMPVIASFVRASASLRNSYARSSACQISDGQILDCFTDELRNIRSIIADVFYSQGLMAIKSKMNLGVSASVIESSMMQNGTMARYRSFSSSPYVSFNCTPVPFTSIDYDANCSFGRYNYYNGLDDSGSLSFEQSLKITVMPKDWPFIDMRFYHYYASIRDESNQTFLLGASARYKINKSVEVCLVADNLLNNKEFSVKSASPLMESAIAYRLRPRAFTFGIKLEF